MNVFTSKFIIITNQYTHRKKNKNKIIIKTIMTTVRLPAISNLLLFLYEYIYNINVHAFVGWADYYYFIRVVSVLFSVYFFSRSTVLYINCLFAIVVIVIICQKVFRQKFYYSSIQHEIIVKIIIVHFKYDIRIFTWFLLRFSSFLFCVKRIRIAFRFFFGLQK